MIDRARELITLADNGTHVSSVELIEVLREMVKQVDALKEDLMIAWRNGGEE